MNYIKAMRKNIKKDQRDDVIMGERCVGVGLDGAMFNVLHESVNVKFQTMLNADMIFDMMRRQHIQAVRDRDKVTNFIISQDCYEVLYKHGMQQSSLIVGFYIDNYSGRVQQSDTGGGDLMYMGVRVIFSPQLKNDECLVTLKV